MPIDRRCRDDELLDDFRRYRETGDRCLRNMLVTEYEWIAARCARRFSDRGEPFDDLMQVGLLAIVRAIDRFDPDYGSSFPKFAIPTVTGELRRHFRDATWTMSVPRRSKDLIPQIRATTEVLSQRYGRTPQLREVADELGVEVECVVEATEASFAYRPASTDRHVSAGPGSWCQDTTGCVDADLDGAALRLTLMEAITALDPRTRRILVWRFYEGLTQAEIAARLDIGQVHVSRLIRAALASLRTALSIPVEPSVLAS